jgi:hypothetical protein
MPGTGARAKHRATTTSCRSSPRERRITLETTILRPEGWPPTNAPCGSPAFMLGTGARANELRPQTIKIYASSARGSSPVRVFIAVI